MIRKTLAVILLAWIGGFMWFVVALPQPLDGRMGEAAIVPTGASGRIERGLALLEQGDVSAMLVTGVDRKVTAEEFAQQFEVPSQTMECCITLGYTAVDTRTNATEATDWIEKHQITSVRLVTTDWHMRRAAGELARVLPPGIAIHRDAVHSEPSLRILFVEYHKFLASTLSGLFERRL